MAYDVTQSELRALDVAFQCLAASLKHSGNLNEDLYVKRLESHITGDYPLADNKEVFDLSLKRYIDDIRRVKGSEE